MRWLKDSAACHSWLWLPLLAISAGASGTLAFSPYDLWPLALLSIVGLLLCSLNCAAKRAFWLAFCWGIGFFGVGIRWVHVSIAQFGGIDPPLDLLPLVCLIIYLALYPALFSFLLQLLFPIDTRGRLILAAPPLWHILERIRGEIFTGFPWLQFGYSQIDGPLSGVAPIAGVEGVTFLLMLISGLIATACSKIGSSIKTLGYSLLLLLLPSLLKNFSWVRPQPERRANVVLVQGNIPQSRKWDEEQLYPVLRTYLKLSSPVVGKADLIIWPETAIPENVDNVWPLLKKIGQVWHPTTQLITGIVDQRDQSYFNSVIVVGEGVNNNQFPPTQIYHKHRLVLFGEVVPMAKWLRPLAPLFNLPLSSMSAGSKHQSPLQAGQYRLATAICYEIIFGEHIRRNFDPEVDFILTISNDSWFNDSDGPWQHFQMARMRALELGRPLLRATNSGITGVIDSQGKVMALLPQFTSEILEASVAPTRGQTPYARWGGIGCWITVGSSLALALWRKYRYKVRRPVD